MKIFLLLVAGLFLFGCKVDKKTSLLEFRDINSDKIQKNVLDMSVLPAAPTVLNITEDCVKKEMRLSSVIDSIQVIKLDNKAEATLGGIDKILLEDSCMYILDRTKTKSLKKFSSEGKYICDIGKKGEGPEEYIEPTDFVIVDRLLIVYDQFGCKLNYYSVEGSFIKTCKLPFLCLQFYAFSPNSLVFNTLDADNQHLSAIVDFSVFATDSLFNLNRRGFFREKDLYSSIFIPSNFNVSNGRLYYHPPFKDMIYSINADATVKAEYKLNFGTKTLPEEFLLAKNWDQFKDESGKGHYLFFPGEFFCADSFFYFSYIKAHVVSRCFYSFSDKILRCSPVVKNDILPILPFANIMGTHENGLVGYAFPYQIVRGLASHQKEQWEGLVGRRAAEIAEGLSEEDNPIIVKYHFR